MIFMALPRLIWERKRFLSQEENREGVVGGTLEALGEKDDKVVVLTAAMEKGLGLEGFAKKFPERFFDVGIAEEH